MTTDKIIRTTRRNGECQVCGDFKGNCGTSSDRKVLFCMDKTASVPYGMKELGLTKNGLWRMIVGDNGGTGDHRPFDRKAWIEKKRKDEAERLEKAQRSLSNFQRHIEYGKLQRQLSLKERHRQNLLQRGISQAKIEDYGYFSIEPKQPLSVKIDPKMPGVAKSGTYLTANFSGYSVPIPDDLGQIVGWQIRNENPNSESPKYTWAWNADYSSKLQNDELPIGYFYPDNYTGDSDVIAIAEGFTKTPVLSDKLGLPTLGAAGAMFFNSPQQFEKYIKDYKTLIFFPDAGSVSNTTVISNYKRSIEIAQKLGLTIKVAWWGQFQKPNSPQEKLKTGDIDDIDQDTIDCIEYLSWEQFAELFETEVTDYIKGREENTSRKRPSAAKELLDLAEVNRKRKEDLTRFTAQETINHRYFPALSIPYSANIVGIKGAKGTGKTYSLAQYIKSDKILGITHRVCLENTNADVFKLDSRHNLTKEGRYLGYFLCINSLHRFANPVFDYTRWDGASIVMDEFDQLFTHLAESDTCQTYRQVIISTLQNLLRHVISTGGKIYMMSADLADIHMKFIQEFIALPQSVEVFTLENTYIPFKGERRSICYEDKADLLMAVDSSLRDGKRVLLMTTSIGSKSPNSTRNLEEYYGKLGYKVLRADSESTTTPDHPATAIFTEQKTQQGKQWYDALRDYNIVVASPVLETGVSIEGVFDEVFYLSESGVQTVESVGQSLARERANVTRHFYVRKTSNRRIRGGKTHWQSILSDMNEDGNKILLSEKNYSLIDITFTGQSFNTLYCQSIANANLGFTDYRASVQRNLEQSGYVVTHFKKTEGEKPVIADLQAIKETKYTEHCESVANAPPLSKEEAESMMGKRKQTDEERVRLKKYHISKSFIEADVKPNLVKQWDEGFYKKILLHYYLTQGSHLVEMRDVKKCEELLRYSHGEICQHDLIKAVISPKIELLNQINVKQFLDPDAQFTEESLSVWFEGIKEKKTAAKIRRTLGISTSNKQTAIAFINQQLLPKLGLQLRLLGRKRNAEGKQVRIYSGAIIEDQRLLYFSRWLERDDAALEAWLVNHDVQMILDALANQILRLMRTDDHLFNLGISLIAEIEPTTTGVRLDVSKLSRREMLHVIDELWDAHNDKYGETPYKEVA